MNRSGLVTFEPSKMPEIDLYESRMGGKAGASKKSSSDSDVSSGKVTGLYGDAMGASSELYALDANINAVQTKLESLLYSASTPQEGFNSQEGQALAQTLQTLSLKKANLLNLQPFAAKEAEKFYAHEQKILEAEAEDQLTDNYPGMEILTSPEEKAGTVGYKMKEIYYNDSYDIDDNTGMYTFQKKDLPSYYEQGTLAKALSAQKDLAVKFSTESAFSFAPLFKGKSKDLSGEGDARFFYQSGSESNNLNYLETLMKNIPMIIPEDAKREIYDKQNKELKDRISKYIYLRNTESKEIGADGKKIPEDIKLKNDYYASGRFGKEVSSDEEMSYAQSVEEIAYRNIYEVKDIENLTDILSLTTLDDPKHKEALEKLRVYDIKLTGDLKQDIGGIKNAIDMRRETADRYLKEVADLSYLKFLESEVNAMLKTQESLSTTSIGLSNLSDKTKDSNPPITQWQSIGAVGVSNQPDKRYSTIAVRGQNFSTAHSTGYQDLTVFGKPLSEHIFKPITSGDMTLLLEGGRNIAIPKMYVDNDYIKLKVDQNYDFVDIPVNKLTPQQLNLNKSFAVYAWTAVDIVKDAKNGEKYTTEDIKKEYFKMIKEENANITDDELKANWNIAKNIIFKSDKGKAKRITQAELEALIPVTKPYVRANLYFKDEFKKLTDTQLESLRKGGLDADSPVLWWNKLKTYDYDMSGIEQVPKSAKYINDSDNPMNGYWVLENTLVPVEYFNLESMSLSKHQKATQEYQSENIIKNLPRKK